MRKPWGPYQSQGYKRQKPIIATYVNVNLFVLCAVTLEFRIFELLEKTNISSS